MKKVFIRKGEKVGRQGERAQQKRKSKTRELEKYHRRDKIQKMCMTTKCISVNQKAQRPRNKTIERVEVNKKIPSSSTQFSHYLVLAN